MQIEFNVGKLNSSHEIDLKWIYNRLMIYPIFIDATSFGVCFIFAFCERENLMNLSMKFEWKSHKQFELNAGRSSCCLITKWNSKWSRILNTFDQISWMRRPRRSLNDRSFIDICRLIWSTKTKIDFCEWNFNFSNANPQHECRQTRDVCKFVKNSEPVWSSVTRQRRRQKRRGKRKENRRHSWKSQQIKNKMNLIHSQKRREPSSVA